MTDFSALIPPHEPAEDTLATVGGMALDAIPLLGPLAGRALDHALATRERERRHEFDAAIVGELQRLAERADDTLTVADVVSSDDFLATLARARREAAETASTTKRQRLARAAVSTLDPRAPKRAERQHYLRLIIELEEMHIWLLGYFHNPRAWLDAHGLSHVYANSIGGSPTGPLEAALGHFGMTLTQSIEGALEELERRALASPQLGTFLTQGGMVQSRTTPGADNFLRYLGEGNPADAAPPTG